MQHLLLTVHREPENLYKMKYVLCSGEVDNEGDEFFDAGAEPSSPSFMGRTMDRAGSQQSDTASFADASSEAPSRAGSFKDAPGPSELWDVKSTGDPLASCM